MGQNRPNGSVTEVRNLKFRREKNQKEEQMLFFISTKSQRTFWINGRFREYWTNTANFFLSPLNSGPGQKVWRMEKMRKARPCLLYTSPSPRDGLLSRMPSSA